MRRLREPAAWPRKMHQKIDEKTIPTEHGSKISRKILEREQHFNMKMLQVKGFWRQKRTVSENQLFYLENLSEIGRHRPRWNVTPVDVSAISEAQPESDPAALKNYQTRYRYD